MQCVARLLLSARDRVFRGAGDEVVLRHETSGRVLTNGDRDQSPVRFRSTFEAGEFRARFLDEAEGWHAIPAVEVDTRAA